MHDLNTEKILAESFRLFSENGFAATQMETIAANLNMSTDCLLSQYDSKNVLVVETCKWKMGTIASNVDSVVSLNLPIIQKFIKYLEVMHQSISDVSMKIVLELIMLREKLSGIIEEYLKGAVYGRLTKLIEQAKTEGKINESVELGNAMMMYWEMLSTVLVTQQSDKLPIQLKGSQPLNVIVGNQIVKAYRNLLNEQGRYEFNQNLASHPILSKVYS